jgi:uncharacterized protein YndB with AHSA1/START domain
MGLTSVQKDPEQLTLTVTADYDVSADRAWQLWADPRQLERWWGPPTYPATVEKHDLSAGGRVSYVMTGPEGDQARGYWDVREVEAPRRLVVLDGFADAAGEPNDELPRTVMTVDIADRPGGVTMTIVSTFPSLEAMEQLVAMGMEEGIQQALQQIDAILAESPVRS